LQIPPPKSNCSCAGGFDEHVCREHNPLDYLIYLYYIINTDINERSGVESRVYNAIYDVSTKTAKGTWLPVLHARSIEQCSLVYEENRADLKVFIENVIRDAASAAIRDAATVVTRDAATTGRVTVPPLEG
jgi:hypothetical protein